MKIKDISTVNVNVSLYALHGGSESQNLLLSRKSNQ